MRQNMQLLYEDLHIQTTLTVKVSVLGLTGIQQDVSYIVIKISLL